MKRPHWILRAGVVLGATVLALSSGGCKKDTAQESTSGAAGPRIELVAPEHDFGNVDEGQTVKHTFTIKNTGKAPLVIERVRTSCGCVAAVNQDKEVAPGGSATIDVSFDTNRRPGNNSQTITLQTNDKENPNAKLVVKAVVEQQLAFLPPTLRLDMKHGEEKSVEAWLTGKLAKDAKLTVSEVTGETGATVELAEKKDGDITTAGIRVKVKATKVGRESGIVRVQTGLDSLPEIALRFDASVVGNIQFRPRALMFDADSKSGSERVLTLTSSREDFKVTAVRVLEGPYEATVKKADSGNGFEVQVTLVVKDESELKTMASPGPGGRPGSVSGRIEIVCNDPLEPKIEVPIQLRRAPSTPRARPSMMVPLGSGRPSLRLKPPEPPTE